MIKKAKSNENVNNNFPAVALRDVVVYPHMVIPLFVGRAVSVKAIETAQMSDSKVFLVAQRDANNESPMKDDLYEYGVVASILQLLKLPDGTIKVLVEGVQRAKLVKLNSSNDTFSATIEIVNSSEHPINEIEALSRTAKSVFEDYVKQNKRIPVEILSPIENITDSERLADSIASHLPVTIEKKQKLLETFDLKSRLELIIQFIEEEVDFIGIETRLKGRVKRQMEKSQREYYLNEQIKAIQNELGELSDSPNEIENFQEKIKKSGMPKEAYEKSMSELSKLKQMPPMSAEGTVCRNYLESMLLLPWNKSSKLCKDLTKAEKVLEEEHYGLDKVKERILEYLAVQQRVKKLKGPILCLVGPPGVGKTSLGRSIANATGRKYVRMSLGGVRDEAEIRGHRRTYVGSMPGKIIQKITKAEVNNPLFLLDEIDKMAMDFRGDPASALLEVLDPEQNTTFNDHYLEVDYDLSDVMFVATANTLNIPAALSDRMEIIRISGYTEDEKLNIAMQHLIPKQVKQNGLELNEINISKQIVLDIIRYYTREAGVRSLERELAKLCRKVVKKILLSKEKIKSVNISPDLLEDYLGVKRFRYGLAENFDQIGQVTGLAWTEVGGELLHIEAALTPGKGKAKYTGRLGDVMQESIHAAMTVIRGRLPLFNIDDSFFDKHDIHIHVPEGATPKDGPSAGVAMCTALVSVLTGAPVKAEVAMTGEITLRGEVLPIGGLKEKLLAAHRGNIKCVIIPEDNRKDLQEIPDNVKADLEIRPVKWIDEVLTIALANYEGVLISNQNINQLIEAEKNKAKKASKSQQSNIRKKSRTKTISTRTH